VAEGGEFDLERSVPFAQSRFNEQDGHFSPDGRWVAYVSNESGTSEVYVRPFSGTAGATAGAAGGTVLVSRGGGMFPRWRRDGKELFYLAPDDKTMAVEATLGAEFHAGTPRQLFQAPRGSILGDVAADGQRFLMVQSAAAPFTVIVNWSKR
jgi:eukaryotic-like serine/threonine-protein kinase